MPMVKQGGDAEASGDEIYSEEDEEEGGSPVNMPTDLKGLLKHKQSQSNFDIDSFKHPENAGEGKVRTLDDFL